MQLEIGNGQILVEPNAELVAGALSALPGPPADSFAILMKSECQFMQCSGWWKDGFILEYQEGSLDEHFQCCDSQLSLPEVIAAFHAYFNNTDQWRTMFEWQKIKI